MVSLWDASDADDHDQPLLKLLNIYLHSLRLFRFVYNFGIYFTNRGCACQAGLVPAAMEKVESVSQDISARDVLERWGRKTYKQSEHHR
jgi:hypothetical protein